VNGATYGNQLNIILPEILFSLKLPTLNDLIRGKLNRLKDLRNLLAHDGHLHPTLERRRQRNYSPQHI
jgi:hypothetical protein